MNHDELRTLCELKQPLGIIRVRQITEGCLFLLNEVKRLRDSIKKARDKYDEPPAVAAILDQALSYKSIRE